MSLSRTQIEHIANLAKLALTQEEMALFGDQLSAILDYVARLQQLDTRDIPPTSSVLPPRSVLRPDETQPCLPLGQLLRNAPLVEKDQFRIPPVFE